MDELSIGSDDEATKGANILMAGDAIDAEDRTNTKYQVNPNPSILHEEYEEHSRYIHLLSIEFRDLKKEF